MFSNKEWSFSWWSLDTSPSNYGFNPVKDVVYAIGISIVILKCLILINFTFLLWRGLFLGMILVSLELVQPISAVLKLIMLINDYNINSLNKKCNKKNKQLQLDSKLEDQQSHYQKLLR